MDHSEITRLKTELAEAVGLLNEAEWSCNTSNWQEKLSAFLARHAQAEEHVCDKQGEYVCHDDACPYHGTQAKQQEALSDAELMDVAMFVGSGNKAARRASALGAAELPERLAPNQEAQGAQAGEFQREDRYIVIKRKDLEAIEKSGEASDLETHEAVRFLAEALDTLRPHLPAREYLVIESDWPEYEPTWAAIQARVIFAERRQVRDISEEEKQAIADRLKSLPTALRGNDYDQ